jgi:hypothetical protein
MRAWSPFLNAACPRPSVELPAARFGKVLGALLLFGGLLLGSSACRGSEPTVSPSLREIQMTLHIRKVLGMDPKLGPLNLWVDVSQTTAILSGDIPSETLARRALNLVGRVPGIGEVRNDMTIAPRDGFLEGPEAFPEGPPSLTVPGSNGSPGDLTGRSKQVPLKTEFPEAEATGRSRPPFRAAITLGAPVVVENPPRERSRTAPVELLTPRPLLPSPSDLGAQVAELCRQNPRFAHVRAETRQGLVSLSGFVARWQDVEDLAQVVRRLPGVQAVDMANLKVAAVPILPPGRSP